MPQSRSASIRPIDPPPQARALYTRVLQSWASDLLHLRRRGLHRPSFRRGEWETADQAGRITPTVIARAEAA